MTASQKITNGPRGIRNNNPGNIRENDAIDFDWLGEAGSEWDPEFEEFSAPEYGIRAIARILNTYARKYQADTIAEIITRWAPSSENDTAAYIASVEKQTGIDRFEIITASEYPVLIEAIIKHENGQQPYPRSLIEYGVSLA